jgi:DNA-binding HxlR family transcriptional regulator
MRSKDFEGMVCPVADVMGAIGDRWGALVMRDLLLGLTRYDDLRRSTGVTNATLSDRLKALERNGLIERRRYQTRPERFEYVPTQRGRELRLLMQAMVQIGDKWNLNGLDGPPIRFLDTQSGHEVKLAFVDAETGELASSLQLRPAPGSGADALMQWRLDRGTRPAE